MAPDDIAVSSVTCYELYTGAAKCADPATERNKVDSFVHALTRFAFDNVSADYAATIRADFELRGEMIGPYDVLIAGHATALGLTLVTGNSSELSRITTLKIEDWGI